MSKPFCQMSSSPPVFSKSAIEGFQLRTENVELALVISIEPDSESFREFWTSGFLLSAMNSNFLVVRLFQDSDEYEISQFSEIYDIPAVPCLFVFPPNSEDEPRVFVKWPSTDELHSLFISMIGYSHEQTHLQVRRVAKISARYGTAQALYEFQPDATVGEVKTWILATFGAGLRAKITHNGNYLPDDDNLTVTQADLVPNALLQLEQATPNVLQDEVLPDLPRRHQDTPEVDPEEPQTQSSLINSLKRILSFVNPFPDADEVEDFFVEKQ